MKTRAITKICVCSVVVVLLAGLLTALLTVPALRNFFANGEIPFLSTALYDDEETYSVGGSSVAEPVKRLMLYWTSGDVHVSTYDGDEITFRESGAGMQDGELRFRLRNGVLTIREYKSGVRWNTRGKSLEVQIPEGMLEMISLDAASTDLTLLNLTATKLDIDSASGDISATGCVFDSVTIDTASGECDLRDCTIGSFDMDSASGSATLSGSVRAIDFGTASGDLRVKSDVAPSKVNFDSASGSADLTLPASAQFTADLDALSGELRVTGFMGSYHGDTFICGDGSADYSFDSASGDATIRCAE